jgi:predicted aminopeptidase
MNINHNVLTDEEMHINLYTSPVEDPSPKIMVIKAKADGMLMEFYENAERTYDVFATYDEWFQIAKRII